MYLQVIFSLIKKCRKLDLPFDIQIGLFDRCMQPILLYESDIWTFTQV